MSGGAGLTIQALLPPRCIGSGDLPGRIGCVGVPRSVITARRNARFEHADCNQSGVVGCVRLPHASLIGGASHGRSEVIFTSKEAGSLTLPRLPHLGNRTTLSVALGDVDGDGLLDVLVGNLGGANELLLQQVYGIFVAAVGFPGGNVDTRSVAFGDVNGDGLLDVLVGNSEGANELLLQQGDGSFVAAVGFPAAA